MFAERSDGSSGNLWRKSAVFAATSSPLHRPVEKCVECSPRDCPQPAVTPERGVDTSTVMERNERFEAIYRRHVDAVHAYARRRAPADLADAGCRYLAAKTG